MGLEKKLAMLKSGMLLLMLKFKKVKNLKCVTNIFGFIVHILFQNLVDLNFNIKV